MSCKPKRRGNCKKIFKIWVEKSNFFIEMLEKEEFGGLKGDQYESFL